MQKPEEHTFKSIFIGQKAAFEFDVSEEAVAKFAEISGDFNPMHTNAAYALKAGYKTPLSHGMLVGALFSRLVGMYLPGLHALYLSQALEFHKPVFFGSRLLIEGVVEQKVDSLNIIKIKTEALELPGRELRVGGVAMVKVLK